jgi:hypothetical protein
MDSCSIGQTIPIASLLIDSSDGVKCEHLPTHIGTNLAAIVPILSLVVVIIYTSFLVFLALARVGTAFTPSLVANPWSVLFFTHL